MINFEQAAVRRLTEAEDAEIAQERPEAYRVRPPSSIGRCAHLLPFMDDMWTSRCFHSQGVVVLVAGSQFRDACSMVVQLNVGRTRVAWFGITDELDVAAHGCGMYVLIRSMSTSRITDCARQEEGSCICDEAKLDSEGDCSESNSTAMPGALSEVG
jgi:hypothetical protein